MPNLTKFAGLYASFLRGRRAKGWQSDLTVFLKRHEDPYNFEGIELVLLHLQRAQFRKLTLQERKRLTIATYAATVDRLMDRIIHARSHITAKEGIPDNFFRGAEQQVLRRFDDYFATQAGHTVSISGVNDSLKDWIKTLIAHMRELETDNPERYLYYMRKLRKLWADVYHTLQGILESSFQ